MTKHTAKARRELNIEPKLCKLKSYKSVYFLGYTIQELLSTFWGAVGKKCLLLRVQFRLGAYRAPNTQPVALKGDICTWVYAGAIQVQIVAIADIDRSRRPIVAGRPSIVGRRRSEAAGVEEVVRISS